MNLDSSDLLLLISCVINLVIFFIIIFNYRKDRTKLSFAGISLGLLIWVFGNFQIDRMTDVNRAVFWTRMTSLGLIVFSISLNYFSIYFPKGRISFAKKALFNLAVISGIALIIFNFVGEFIVSDVDVSTRPAEVYHGDLYYPLVIWIISIIVYSYINLFLKLRWVQEYKYRIQIKILLIGLSSVSALSVFTNLVLPNLGIPDFTRIGPISIVLVSSLTTYIILRYKFLEIRILVGRMFYYSLAGLFVLISFLLGLFLTQEFLVNFSASVSLLAGGLGSIIFVLIFNNANDYIKANVNLRIINPGYNPNESIAKLSDAISSVLDIHVIVNETISIISKTIRPDYVSVMLNSQGGGNKIFEGKNTINLAEEEVNIIYRVFQQTDILYIDLLSIEELEPNLKNTELKELFNLQKLIGEKGIQLLVPFKQENSQYVGILMLGAKDGGAPYNNSELRYIKNITELLSVTLGRSSLYEEVLNFNENLKLKVEEATDELKEKNDQLAEALRKEKDMMDILGHELRTPLGTARNAIVMLDSLKKENKLSEEQLDKYIKIAIDNIRREKTMLETILQSARLENSRLQILMTKVPVDELLQNSFDAVREAAEKKGLEVKIENEAQGVLVKADQTAIQQMLDNFASNSVKYTKDGQVTIFARRENENKLRIGISDTGEGISKEDLPNIGKKFFRANPYLESEGTIGDEEIVRPGGTGIGMYVVKGILEAMGSKLDIESELGKGSTFSAVFEIVDENDETVSDEEQEKPLG